MNESGPAYPHSACTSATHRYRSSFHCAGWLATVNDSASPSTSEADRVTPTATSRGVETDTDAATGASLTAETLIDTVAMFESTVPSLALNVNESGPLKLALGVYVTLGAVPVSTPCAGCATIANDSTFAGSASLAWSTMAIGVSSGVLATLVGSDRRRVGSGHDERSGASSAPVAGEIHRTNGHVVCSAGEVRRDHSGQRSRRKASAAWRFLDRGLCRSTIRHPPAPDSCVRRSRGDRARLIEWSRRRIERDDGGRGSREVDLHGLRDWSLSVRRDLWPFPSAPERRPAGLRSIAVPSSWRCPRPRRCS